MADPAELPRFDGRVVLVTGGCRGIGRGIAQRFVDAGAHVAICCRHEPDDLPDGWLFVAADIREAEQVDAVIAATVDRFGALDVLVNNAGGSPPADTATASPRFTAGIIALNLTAALVCAQKANAVMQTQEHGGSIVNIASVSGVRPSPNTVAYGAAKAGLLNATQTLAVELAPKVRVNGVAPGGCGTDLRGPKCLGFERVPLGGVPVIDELVKAVTPLGFLPAAEDYAGMYVLLASRENSRTVTGSILRGDGGIGVRGLMQPRGGDDL